MKSVPLKTETLKTVPQKKDAESVPLETETLKSVPLETDTEVSTPGDRH